MISSLKKGYGPYIYIIIKLLVIYVVLLKAFYFYVGALNPNGLISWPWLNNFSIIQGVLNCLIYPTIWVLELFGYATRHSSNSVGIANDYGVHIAFSCLGIKVMIAYTTLLLSFPGKKKLPYWIIGILMIHLINLIRVITIVFVFKQNYNIVIITHDLFNYFAYGSVILLFYFWFKKHLTLKINTND